MTVYALLLVLLSAVLHSVWNVLLRDCRDTETASYLQMLFSLPFLFIAAFLSGRLPAVSTIPTLIFSSVMQAAYYLLLSRCYRSANLSVVYPLTRGSAPVFVCLFSVLLGTEQLTLPVFFALMLIVFGIYLVNMPSLKVKDLLAPFRTLASDKSTRISFLIGITIALYTISDKQNVKADDPMVVCLIITLLPFLMLSPFLFRPAKIRSELSGAGWLRILVIAVCTFLGYFLVLAAMQTTNASYVSAIREVSVVMVAAYVVLRTKDKNFLPKVVGAVIIFIGILLVSILS
jgi:drug/metabolite transporter (DMT)-like permease